MNVTELANNQLTHVIGENNNGEEVVITLPKPLYPESFVRQQQAEIEALKAPKIPLLEQEIKFILGNGQCWTGEDCSMPNLMYIIRAVEAAHGIGVNQDE